jgi:hypothetical protein
MASRIQKLKLLKPVLFSQRLFSALSKKESLFERTKKQTLLYFNGIKLLFKETKEAQLLKLKMEQDNYLPTRPEFLFLHRNNSDLSKLVPFALIAIISPEIIPWLLVRGSTLIPSTCISDEQLQQKTTKLAKTRLELNKKLIELSQVNGLNPDDLISNNISDLDSMSRQTLSFYAQFYGMSKWRPKFIIKRNLNNHAEYLRKDNKFLRLPEIELSQKDMDHCAEERGISVSLVENSKELIDQWVEAEEKIPCNGKLLSVSIYKTIK